MNRIYPIEQLEHAPDIAARHRVLLDMSYGHLLLYQDQIERVLLIKRDQTGLNYLNTVVAFLHCTDQGRADIAESVLSVRDQVLEQIHAS